jgi:hypothetical protein
MIIHKPSGFGSGLFINVDAGDREPIHRQPHRNGTSQTPASAGDDCGGSLDSVLGTFSRL